MNIVPHSVPQDSNEIKTTLQYNRKYVLLRSTRYWISSVQNMRKRIHQLFYQKYRYMEIRVGFLFR